MCGIVKYIRALEKNVIAHVNIDLTYKIGGVPMLILAFRYDDKMISNQDESVRN